MQHHAEDCPLPAKCGCRRLRPPVKGIPARIAGAWAVFLTGAGARLRRSPGRPLCGEGHATAIRRASCPLSIEPDTKTVLLGTNIVEIAQLNHHLMQHFGLSTLPLDRFHLHKHPESDLPPKRHCRSHASLNAQAIPNLAPGTRMEGIAKIAKGCPRGPSSERGAQRHRLFQATCVGAVPPERVFAQMA